MRRIGSIQQKIIIALLGGVAMGMSHSPRTYFKTVRNIKKEWRKIDQRKFTQSLKKLSKEKLITEETLPNGSFKCTLTEKGEREAKRLDLFGSSIKFKKPNKWDKKWRIVLFDIPEEDREFRNILRSHLYDLDFAKLQHSVFVSPYPFEKSIAELVNLYSAHDYVRIITAIKIDNEAKLKNIFKSFVCKI